MKWKETQLLYLVIKLTKPYALPKACIRWKTERHQYHLFFELTDNQTFFEKCAKLKQPNCFQYQSSPERKNFVKWKETQLLYLVTYQINEALCSSKGLYEMKNWEVSVSSFSQADNYAVVTVKLRAAIVRVSWHFLEEWFKMFLMQCNKDARDALMWIESALVMNDISAASLKILDNISVIINTKKFDNNTTLSFSSCTILW